MKRTNHRFTQEEDKVILSNAKKIHGNLQLSFRTSASQLELKVRQVEGRYYNILRKNNQCFLSISEKEAFLNRKIVKDFNNNDYKVNLDKSFIKKWYTNFVKLFKKC